MWDINSQYHNWLFVHRNICAHVSFTAQSERQWHRNTVFEQNWMKRVCVRTPTSPQVWCRVLSFRFLGLSACPSGRNLKEWLQEQFCDKPLDQDDMRLHNAAYVGDLDTLRNLLQEDDFRRWGQLTAGLIEEQHLIYAVVLRFCKFLEKTTERLQRKYKSCVLSMF